MFRADTKWIWLKEPEEPDEYASFVERYHTNGGKVILKIAAETNYIAYVNGKRIAFGQFPGYRDEKYYDEIDITESSGFEENELRIVVRYEGLDTLNHIRDRAGVIFEVTEGKRVLCYSSAATLGAFETSYRQHVCRIVTPQLGFASDMCTGGLMEYDVCRETEITYNLKKRPVRKLKESAIIYGEKMDIPGREIYDFGRETVGYLILTADSEKDSEIVLAYGEHLADGMVRQKIGSRNFSLKFYTGKGHHSFEQLFVRIAGRYVEVFRDKGVKIESVGILPVMYPMEEKERFLDGLEGEIYDTSVRTLRLCMHEHYEDCPWREQALYVLDARNQMLCGYYAFKDNSFARANIVFISKGKREDGLLELTYPAVNTPAIPFFSIMYPVMVYEYIKYTGDASILEEVMPIVRGIMERLYSMVGENHLLKNLPSPYWNFYEWSEGSSGCDSDVTNRIVKKTQQHDLILNCAFVYAGIRYRELCRLTDEPFYMNLEIMRKAIETYFYDTEKGMYFLSDRNRSLFGQLGNAFAKLIGLGGENLEAAVKGEYGVVPATLSTMTFVYDALLDGSEEHKEFVLQDIKKNYSYMLKQGATSFWETIEGHADFDNAGSLCHGWSAIPVYYYNVLIGK